LGSRVFCARGGVTAYVATVALLEILLGTGLVTGVVVAGPADPDCARRGTPSRGRLVRALGCGGGSFVGFFAPDAFSGQLQRLYFQVLKPRPVAARPREWRDVSLATGLLIGVVLVGLYVVGTRLRTGRRPETG
jgi:hypothetical protein